MRTFTLVLESTPSTVTRSTRTRQVFRKVLRAIALLSALLALTPIVALPFLTAVPLAVALLLLAAGAAMLIALVMQRTVRMTFAYLVAIALMSVVAVYASQHFARTPAYTMADGRPLPDSIAVMEPIDLNGSRQWITIRSKDVDNPVLLFLAGGPGGSELAWTRSYLPQLEEHFVVVNWDQAGAGKSYGALEAADMTVERYVEDAHTLVEELRMRFHQEKIYVVGESWGTILGIKLVQAYPDLFYAFVGSGQMVNTVENDRLGYDLALQFVQENGDLDTAAALQRNGPPPYFDGNPFMQYARYLMVLNSYMAAHAPGDGRSYNQLGAVLTGDEYGLIDKVNWFRGLNDTFNAVYPHLVDLDFTTQATRLETPIYFTVGRHDVNAMASLVERYYSVLEAPHKELVWFEKSGHTPLWEERDKFVDVLVNQVLADTQPRPEHRLPAPVTDAAAVEAFFDEVIPHQLRTEHIAGAAVAVVGDGGLHFAKGYGYADLAARTPVVADRTLLRTDSSGKLFVWTAVMQLVEAGALSLNVDVNEYLDFQIPATYAQPITLRHLLSHTAGFEDQGYLFAHREEDVAPTGVFLANHIPARIWPPGEFSAYSNYGTALAGYIVERVSGLPFEQYVAERIFEPLGMTHSTFEQPLPDELAANASVNYRYADGLLQPRPFQFLRIPSAGEGHMTVTDMARFMQAHLAAGDGPMLASETRAQMHGRLFAHHPEVNGFAYGFAESTINGRRVLRHEGNNPGMSSSSLFVIPEEGVGVYVAYNSNGGFGPGQELRRAFFNRFYPARAVPTTPVVLTQAEVQAISGSYRPTRRFRSSFAKILPLFAPAYGDVVIRANSDGTFAVSGLDAAPLTYVPVGSGHLRLLSGAQDSWGDLRLRRDEGGRIRALFAENQPYKAFEKVAWHQAAMLQRTIGLFGLLAMAAFLVAGALIWLLQRRLPSSRLFSWQPWSWRLLAGGCLLMLVFVVALLFTIEEAYLYGATPAFLGALALPLIALVLTGGSLLIAFGDMHRREWGILSGALYGAGVFSMAVTAGWLFHWRLLGWQL